MPYRIAATSERGDGLVEALVTDDVSYKNTFVYDGTLPQLRQILAADLARRDAQGKRTILPVGTVVNPNPDPAPIATPPDPPTAADLELSDFILKHRLWAGYRMAMEWNYLAADDAAALAAFADADTIFAKHRDEPAYLSVVRGSR